MFKILYCVDDYKFQYHLEFDFYMDRINKFCLIYNSQVEL